MKNICVYLGSNSGAGEQFQSAARSMGEELVRRGLGLVYGGSDVGLMGVLADAVLGAGGRAVGVIPQVLVEKSVAHAGLSELIVVADMHERKSKMIKLSDGFVALPGGLGTMEEFFEVLCWSQLGLHEKPCGLLNVDGFYGQLGGFLDNVARMGFVKTVHRDMAMIEQTPAALLDRFERFEPSRVSKWIK